MTIVAPTWHDSPFTILAGGWHRCDPSWTKAADGIDQCYKLYYPERGHARLMLESQVAPLRPDAAYLVPGYRLTRQECRRRMEVYWLHFVPESPQLACLLSHVSRVHVWNDASLAYWRATLTEIPLLFTASSSGLRQRVQAMLMDMVAQVLETYDLNQAVAADVMFERLKPAIAFMDDHLLDNPRLAEIAAKVHLAPNYFHRKFTAVFRVTPFGYMLNRRLNIARQLLLGTDMTLDRIAAQCGFWSGFHLSKLFKKHHGMSPKAFRRRALP